MKDEIRIKELEQQLKLAQEKLRRSQEEIEDKYGPDYLALLQGRPVEQPIKVVKKVCRIVNEQGELMTTLTEEYIEKRDGTLVLVRLVA
jgi:hypothetical protein